MRKSRLAPTCTLFALALTLSCGGDESTGMDPEPRVPTTITVTPPDAELTFINETVTLSASVFDQDGARIGGAIDWSSDDATVATVGVTGIVRAVANGTANITAAIGTISASAAVTVAQVPSQIALVSGGEQEVVAGQSLPDPIVVVVWDRAGSPVPGSSVTFAPAADNGTVTVESVDAGPDGRAETAWTLGPTYGPQTLNASTDGADLDVAAFAWAETPTPDLTTAAEITVRRPDPSSLETMRVRTTVTNMGNEVSGTYRVTAVVDGNELAAADFPSLARDEEQLVELEIGPLDAGQHDLSMVIDPTDAIEELNETNNEESRNLFIVSQEVVPFGVTTGISLDANEEVIYRLDVPPGADDVLTIEVSGVSGDADLFVEAVERPSARTGYDDCVSAGPTNSERCQLLDAEGSYHIMLHAAQEIPATGVTFEASLGDVVLPYNLELAFVDSGSVSQNQAFRDAATRWSELLVGDLPDQDFTGNPIPDGWCQPWQPAVTGNVDDVIIFVRIAFIDGPLGILARAGPCFVRHQTLLPVMGIMEFDQADLDRLELDGDMEEVVLHEMGHVLGLGTIWQSRGLLEAPSIGNPGADTHFRGPRAILAFDAAGGDGYTAGGKVPVENLAGPGSGDAHWRESVLDEELMTPFLDGLTLNPLSAITVESMADLGYQVDLSLTDPFAKVFTATARAPGAESRIIDLRGDTRTGPIAVVDERGRIVQILR